MRVSFPKSHAYPGGSVSVTDEDGEDGVVEVEFGDGSTVFGTVRFQPEGGFLLDLPGYRTARGHMVAARAWLLIAGSDPSRRRVVRPGPAAVDVPASPHPGTMIGTLRLNPPIPNRRDPP